jgi:two-component system, LuxR family, sensor kinase FixL
VLRPAAAARSRPRREQFASTLAIAIAFFLVFVGAAALDLNLVRLRDSFSWVDHTDQVLLQVGLLQSELVDSGAANRNFAATREPGAVNRLAVSHGRIAAAIAALRNLCADNPPQLRRLGELETLIARRTSWENEQVQARQTDPTLEAPVDTPDSLQLGTAIRNALRQFRSTEITLLTERQRRVSRDATITTALAAGTMLLSLLSGGLGIALLLRERQRHRLTELQTELTLVSRLNSIGQTASVLAHEINQPLTATRNYVNGARRLLRALSGPDANRAGEALTLAQAQIERATQIVTRLRRHVQGEGPDRTVVNATALVEEAVQLSGLRSNEGLELRVDAERGTPEILADAVQLQQVLINLMRNAVDAMEGRTPRRLHITTRRDRDSLLFSVQDTGSGLAAGMAERLFRPFPSSKPGGMGVGLSICRSIVEAHGGRIWAEPAPGGGTVFAFTVPLARKPAPAESPRALGPGAEPSAGKPMQSPG